MKPQVWDTFMFRGELDILELRLRHLEGHVHRHVIVESDTTFSGNGKPLCFWENRERFRPWASRIIYLSVSKDDLPKGADMPMMAPTPMILPGSAGWKREHAQREYCRRGIAESEPEDIILHGDVDEIPSLRALKKLRRKPPAAPVALAMRNQIFAVDWLHPDPWHGTMAVTRKKLGKVRMANLRRRRHAAPAVKGGGWHFSWLGGPDAIRAKIAGAAHQELAFRIGNANEAGHLYGQGLIPWEEPMTQMDAVEVDESYPEYIWKRECPETWFRPREQE